MTSEINHPVFGPVVRDDDEEDLLTFRHFPHLKPFWHADSEDILSCSDLSDEHRGWILDWQNHIEDLLPICSDMTVHAAMQSLGVFGINVSLRKGDEPSPAQIAAYDYFNEHEQQICANVTDALLRYYNFARVHLADWFDFASDGKAYPDNPTPERLGKEVLFVGLTVCRSKSHGIAPLSMSWDPWWDSEHGLQMALYQDQVISVGKDIVDEMIDDPNSGIDFSFDGYWGDAQRTDAERAAFQNYVSEHEPAEFDDDEDDDWDDE